jgi:hypothetical protein
VTREPGGFDLNKSLGKHCKKEANVADISNGGCKGKTRERCSSAVCVANEEKKEKIRKRKIEKKR